jgi:dTDP-4-dehydrorhamnose reductase
MKQNKGIWLIGAQGMLGRQMAIELEKKGFFFYATDQEIDICQMPALLKFVQGKDIGWLVNCAAYTAVDRAEAEPEQAFAVNAAGVENLARLSRILEAKLVHFSTDYVFDGRSRTSYRENDRPRPLSQYGRSKRQGEIVLAANLDTFFLFRISWLYGVHGPSFVQTMLKIFREKEVARVVCDQFGSPTYAATLAVNIADLIASGSDRYGIYHYCDIGVISWYEFAARIMDLGLEFGWIEKKIPLLAIPTSAFPTAAVRPAHAVLDSGKAVRDLGFRVHDWQENLIEYFREKMRLGERPS